LGVGNCIEIDNQFFRFFPKEKTMLLLIRNCDSTTFAKPFYKNPFLCESN
jgi:hypothetical protein